jgi:hypothetical protein
MLAAMDTASQPQTEHAQEVDCDLCILGAGIAGLNALFAATRYLSRNQTVVLVDRRAAVGGMWQSAYDYVRLHQPHPFFTAGDTAWTFGKERSHLASRSEVVTHLTHCLATSRKRVTLDERFGYEYRWHDETGAGPDRVLVECDSTVPGAPGLRIRAKKVIKAFGINVLIKHFMRWFPVQRRVLAGLRFVAFRQRNPQRLRRTLDVVGKRFSGVRCGLLEQRERSQAVREPFTDPLGVSRAT